jgi:phage protein D
MAQDQITIEIDGQEIPQLYADLVRLEVELDDELAGMFRITLALILQADGTWTYLDDDTIRPWMKVAITAGTQDDSQQLILGYITHIRPDFQPLLDQCQLEIWGMDAGVLMDRDDVLRDWPNKKDSDIAEETFRAYGLDVKVSDTTVVHDEEVSTIIQRETDMQFLQRLAARNGFECFIDATAGYFRPTSVDPPAQPVLAIQFGDETNVTRLQLEVNALTSTDVTAYQIDHLSKEVLDATADPDRQTLLGTTPLRDFLPDGQGPPAAYLGQVATTGAGELAAICQGLHDQAQWFVTGEGELDSSRYGSILKPRMTVVVKGAGRTYSGTYYVTRVTHTLTRDGYTQLFEVKRNALTVTGSEDFAGSSDGLSIGRVSP